MEELLTLKDIARQLDVPESNLRYYRNRIGDFLPSSGKGRKRRYFPEAIEIFRRTVDNVQEGMSLDRIYKVLASDRPMEIESIGAISQEDLINKITEGVNSKLLEGAASREEPGTIMSMIETLRDELRGITDCTQSAEEKGRAAEAVSNLKKENERLKSEIEASNRKIEAFEAEIASKERILQSQREQLLDARNKRLNIEKELGEIRELLKKMGSQ